MYTKQLRKGEQKWYVSQQLHNAKVVPKVMSFVECQAIETRRTKRNSHIPEDPAQVGTEYTYGQLYMYQMQDSPV
jgi:hypothetical protein